VSPELEDALPRDEHASLWDAVGPGFGGACVGRGVGEVDDAEEERRAGRVWAVLQALAPDAWAASACPDAPAEPSAATRAFAARSFLSPFACERATRASRARSQLTVG
jgi:methylphosphotriester-DNA--protein-cysteine methyltransferase